MPFPRPPVRTELPWLTSGPLWRVHVDVEPELDAFLRRWDYERLVLEGSRMTSRASAHAHLHEVFGLAEWAGPNWDAFNDAFGHWVVEHDGIRLAVVWRDLDVAVAAAPASTAEMMWGLLECTVGDMPTLHPRTTAEITMDVFAVGTGRDFDRPV
ncbi:barstar family protein [Knoellia sp. LjRoot47]|uniref:barstar family protein n=1 Tax=Knoellia sp. LjRoot47 TaxID=3342330 RepID=UPI003ECDE195